MTTFRRGDVVIVRFPNSDLTTYKKRPAIVVLSDEIDTGIAQTLVTSNLQRTGPTRVSFVADSEQGRAMGLLSDSVVVTDNLATVLFREIDKVIGTCPAMVDINAALRQTLAL